MDYELKNGDCLELMKDIKTGSIDMILCDLPYGTTQNKWDSIIPLNLLWEGYERIIKDNGAIILTAQTPFDKILGVSNLRLLKYEWIWVKNYGTGFLNAKKAPLKDHENILVFYKKQPTYNPQMLSGRPYSTKKGTMSENYNGDSKDMVITDNNGLYYPKTTIKFNRDKEKLHPTQKPLSLFAYLIRTYTNENDIILDNAMGSGTTGVAAKLLNRRFIGIEKDTEIFNIATKRIEYIDKGQWLTKKLDIINDRDNNKSNSLFNNLSE